MDLNKMRKEITELIDDVKYHSDSLTPEHTIPTLQINIILAKMHLMVEKTTILKHYLELESEDFEESRQEEKRLVAEGLKVTQELKETSSTENNSDEEKQDTVDKKSTSTRNLKAAIGIYERYLFANELFNNSIEAFDEAIQTLNDLETADEAMYYIREGLIKEFNWEEDNKHVQQFCDIIERKFKES